MTKGIGFLMMLIGMIGTSFAQLRNLNVTPSNADKVQNVEIQKVQNAHYCYSHEYMLQQISQNPDMMKEQEKLEIETERLSRLTNENENQKQAVITIPVVFHVLYNSAYENISDQQIQSQIDQWNRDFNKANWDSVYIPSVFKSKYTNMNIKFCLANRTPGGAPSKGIIRKSTTKTTWTTGDAAIKRSAQGGDDAWNRDNYLNVWVVGALSGNVLAYATFPGGPAADDGIVSWNECFGTTGTVIYPYSMGKVLTHEVGHWLNLRHIWGDDGGACTGSDQVGDTPNAWDANYGDPTFPHITCGNGPNGDMFMNHMDYVNDQSKNMFTTGQKTRATTALNTTRVAIQTSNGCVAPNATTFSVPSGILARGINENSASIWWNTVAGASSFEVQYRKNGTTAWITKTAAQINYRISGLTVATKYDYRLRAIYANGNSAYSAIKTFTTASNTTCSGDPFEFNDTYHTPCPINSGKNYYAKLSATDMYDWYILKSDASKPYIRITLSNLQQDYDLQANLASGTFLASSTNSGTTNDVVNLAGASGEYFLVNVNIGANMVSTACYKLIVEYKATPFLANDDDIRLQEPSNEAIVKVDMMPNPASNEAHMNILTNENINIAISVIDNLGKVVYANNTVAMEGENLIELPVNEFTNGLYQVIVSGNNFTEMKKLIVNKNN